MTRRDFAPTQIDFVHRGDLPASDMGYGPLAAYVRGLGDAPACRADACGQDPSRCPTPEACQVCPQDDPRGIGVIRGLLWSVCITLVCIGAAALIAAVAPLAP